MLYHRQKEKLITETGEKTNQDSTQNSQTPHSIDNNRLTLRNKKKSLTSLIARKARNSQKSRQKMQQIQRDNFRQSVQIKITKKHGLYRKNTGEGQQTDPLKTSIQSCTKSTQSLNLKKHIKNNLNQGSKKQFKLIYQLKKNKNQKKGTNQKQSQIESRQTLSFVTSESNFKSSKVSKTSEFDDSCQNGLIFSKRKINLEERIKKLKGQQQKKMNIKNQSKQLKEEITPQTSDIPSINSVTNLKRSFRAQQSRSNSKKKTYLKQTKESTLNIKVQPSEKSNLTSYNSSKHIKISSLENNSVYRNNKNNQHQQSFEMKINSKIAIKKTQPTQILQSQSFLPQQSFQKNKLSSIKQEKHEDTIQKSIKASIRDSVQTSNNKSLSGNSMNLSINSVVNRSNKRKQSFNLLQISENKQSRLRNSIQSMLSVSSNSKSRINLKFFIPQKNQKFNILDADQSDFQQNLTTMDRLNFHLDIIHTLSDFVYNSTQISTDAQEWEELNFLVYKKFYIERVKVLQFLKKYPMKNPFCIQGASIQTKQVLKLLKEPEIKQKKKILQAQNQQIKKNLHYFYKQFQKQKYGQKINLFEYDNFSHWIFEELWQDFVLVQHNPDYSSQQIYQRMSRILQVGFLISQTNGNYVTPFRQAEEAIQKSVCRTYVSDNKQNYQTFVLKRLKL